MMSYPLQRPQPLRFGGIFGREKVREAGYLYSWLFLLNEDGFFALPSLQSKNGPSRYWFNRSFYTCPPPPNFFPEKAFIPFRIPKPDREMLRTQLLRFVPVQNRYRAKNLGNLSKAFKCEVRFHHPP
jgi:hypothetical protein